MGSFSEQARGCRVVADVSGRCWRCPAGEQEAPLPRPLASVKTLHVKRLVSMERRKALKLYKEP